ncbi:UNVERIFIED_CONTAM: hypothetical protein RMT77_008143 [Armadillidium vulgare]
MYTQNSNRDMFLSQQWSQIDSQDWNTQISSQDANPHRVPTTPSGRVLPPTPSTSGNQNGSLSSSWSGRAGSQVVPQSVSYPSTPRGFVRESNFIKEMRYALHAVLAVMKDLPAKLREIILSTSGSQNNSDVICENLKKIIEEKAVGFEKVFSVLKENESFFTETKKSQELIHSSMGEFQKTLLNQGEEVASLNGDIRSRSENLKKQFALLRKLYITESKKLQTLLASLRSTEIEVKLEEEGLRISSEIKELSTTMNAILNHLKEREEAETSAMLNVNKEMTWLKSYIRDLPSIIDKNNRKREIPLAVKHNVRIVESPWKNTNIIGNRKSHFTYSPVARVAPQVKGITQLDSEVERTKLLKKEESEISKSLLDVINSAADKRIGQSSNKTPGYTNYMTGPSIPPSSNVADQNSISHSLNSSITSNFQQGKAVEKFSSSSSRMKMCIEKEGVFFNRPANRFRPF